MYACMQLFTVNFKNSIMLNFKTSDVNFIYPPTFNTKLKRVRVQRHEILCISLQMTF